MEEGTCECLEWRYMGLPSVYGSHILPQIQVLMRGGILATFGGPLHRFHASLRTNREVKFHTHPTK